MWKWKMNKKGEKKYWNVPEWIRNLEVKAQRLDKTKSGTIKERSDAYEEAASAYKDKEALVRAKTNYTQAKKVLESNREDREKYKDKIAELEGTIKAVEERQKEVLESSKGRRFGQRRTISAFASVIFFIFALVFISFRFTGFTVLNITEGSYRWIGLCFFVCGLALAFISLRKK